MTYRELQLRLLYAVIVAGKSAKFAERATARLFAGLGNDLPFDRIRVWAADGSLDTRLRETRVGNYGKISKALAALADAGIDLRTCGPAELETIHGIGPKTARFFIIWTRPDARVAVLDVISCVGLGSKVTKPHARHRRSGTQNSKRLFGRGRQEMVESTGSRHSNMVCWFTVRPGCVV